jgi:hypothetical protein
MAPRQATKPGIDQWDQSMDRELSIQIMLVGFSAMILLTLGPVVD